MKYSFFFLSFYFFKNILFNSKSKMNDISFKLTLYYNNFIKYRRIMCTNLTRVYYLLH